MDNIWQYTLQSFHSYISITNIQLGSNEAQQNPVPYIGQGVPFCNIGPVSKQVTSGLLWIAISANMKTNGANISHQ